MMTSPHGTQDTFEELLNAVDRLLALPETDGGDRPYVDVVADLLGYLARRLTELHEARLAEVRSFLTWLEERLGCPVDDLSGKTYVREYYVQEDGVHKLLEVIERNHPSVTGLDVSAPVAYGRENPERERIVEGFEESMSRLRPIHREIELTDRLIDLVVYRLFGLEPDEVEFVEGTLPARSPFA